MPLVLDEVAAVAGVLRSARSALFITGAGISADSGLPTYRGIGGLYEDVATDEGVPIEVALSGAMLRERPALTWRYLLQIERACRGARHNRAHEILAALERRIPRACLLTQNVDGFHDDAGSLNVIEIHGNLRRLVCTGCARRERVLDYARLEVPPRCGRCGGLVRPEVVLFGEWLPADAVAALQRELDRGFEVIVAIGTTASFSYIAEPVLAAAAGGIPTVEINPAETTLSRVVRHRIADRAVVALEAVFAALDGDRRG